MKSRGEPTDGHDLTVTLSPTATSMLQLHHWNPTFIVTPDLIVTSDPDPKPCPHHSYRHVFIHDAAVKALAWAPFQCNLLATGAGSADGKIRLFNTSSGEVVSEREAPVMCDSSSCPQN